MSVSTLVLLGLAVVWAIVLLPEAIKRISKARSGDSIRSFNHQLSSLQRQPAGGNVIDLRSARRSGRPAPHPAGPRSAAPAPVSPGVRRRRQEVLTVLGSAAVLTLLCSVAFGGPFLLLFLVAAALLVAYCLALYQVTNAGGHAVRNPYGDVMHASMHRSGDLPGLHGVHGVRVSPATARRVAN